MMMILRPDQFMAWERNYKARVEAVRAKELKYQWLTYVIEVLLRMPALLYNKLISTFRAAFLPYGVVPRLSSPWWPSRTSL